jgi:hypothetical protein
MAWYYYLFRRLEHMDPLGKPVEEDNIGSFDDTMSTVEPEVEYEARDPIPGVWEYNPIDEYLWMQQAIENNLANNELMIAIMVQMHHEWGGLADYPPSYVPGQHDEWQPGGLAPVDVRDEILVVLPKQIFSHVEND